MSETRTIKLSSIITTAGTQMREAINEDVVLEYTEATDLPPVSVFEDVDGSLYLWDGFHRYSAASRTGKKTIKAEVQPGCLRDAILAAVGANADHGLRRRPEDKRRAVLTLLNDPEGEWSKWSDSKVAKLCRVSQPFVGKVKNAILTYNVISENCDSRQESETVVAPESEPGTRTYVNKHGQVSTMKTGNIGKKRKSVVAPEPEEQPEEQPEPQPQPVAKSKPARTRKISGGTSFNVDELEEAEPLAEPAPEAATTTILARAKEIKREYQELRKQLMAVWSEIKKYANTCENGMPLQVCLQSMETHITAVGGYLKSEEPHCVCFYCHGDGCTTCDNKGWLHKRRYHTSHTEAPADGVTFI